jgi:hypothetical protein
MLPTKDNTINITSVEAKMYNKKDMEKSFNAGIAFASQFREATDFGDEIIKNNPKKDNFEDWIKENL